MKRLILLLALGASLVACSPGAGSPSAPALESMPAVESMPALESPSMVSPAPSAS
jgi:hypothetical protein